MTDEQRTLRIRVICLQAPESDKQRFGLQGRKRALHSAVPQPDGSLRFECEPQAKRGADAVPNFLSAGRAGVPLLGGGWQVVPA